MDFTFVKKKDIKLLNLGLYDIIFGYSNIDVQTFFNIVDNKNFFICDEKNSNKYINHLIFNSNDNKYNNEILYDIIKKNYNSDILSKYIQFVKNKPFFSLDFIESNNKENKTEYSSSNNFIIIIAIYIIILLLIF